MSSAVLFPSIGMLPGLEQLVIGSLIGMITGNTKSVNTSFFEQLEVLR
jgi:hypothetical protein